MAASDSINLLPGLASLPNGPAGALLGRDGFFSTPAWWRTVWAAGVPEGAKPLFALHGEGPDDAVLLPLLRTGTGLLEALTTPYTCLYPLAAAPAANLAAAGMALARLAARTPFMRLDALDPDDPRLTALLQGARAGGLVPLRFDHFGNWREEVAGRDWQAYLSSRPGALRETVRRRLRAAERDPALSFACLTAPVEVAGGIAEYEAVYARSWKEPEPFPRFNTVLMQEAAQEGALRLGVLRRRGMPIAVQLWIVHEDTAAVLKLAHDEAFKPISPGTALAAWMLRRLIDGERVSHIDFGRGDDPYKRMWTSQRRQRVGVVLANPRHPGGMAALLRHGVGRLRRTLRGPARG